MIDQNAGVYPMVGPGQAYDEMITGEHIASRTQVEIKAARRVRDVLGAPAPAGRPLAAATTRRCSACWSRARRGQRRALLQQFDRDVVGRADEGHAPVARRPVDGHAVLHQAPAGRIDVLDGVGQVAEIASAAIGSGSQLWVNSTWASSSPGAAKNTSVNRPGDSRAAIIR